MNGQLRPVLPLPGPLEVDPTAAVYELAGPAPDAEFGMPLQLARAMLASAVVDVQRGAFDERILTWLAGWDVATVATVASLLRRCWQAGAAAGRQEVLDERPIVQHLRASLAALEDDLWDRNARVAELLLARDSARSEVALLTASEAAAQERAEVYGQNLDPLLAANEELRAENARLAAAAVAAETRADRSEAALDAIVAAAEEAKDEVSPGKRLAELFAAIEDAVGGAR